jgi:hypothetical protein
MLMSHKRVEARVRGQILVEDIIQELTEGKLGS